MTCPPYAGFYTSPDAPDGQGLVLTHGAGIERRSAAAGLR